MFTSILLAFGFWVIKDVKTDLEWLQ